MQSEQARFDYAEEFMNSLEASYKLYNYLLGLMVKVTDYRRAQIETARNKYLPTQEEKFPNTRFIDNSVVRLVRDNSQVLQYCEEHELMSDFDTETYRAILNDIERSPIYMAYMSQPTPPTFEQDKELWKEIFHTIIPNCQKLDEILEERNLYWNDDLTTVTTFVVKTLQKIKPDTEFIEMAQMFKSDEDKQFARELFNHTIEHAHEYLQRIEGTATNWETSRMAMMDKAIMVCAISEIVRFSEIPVRISLNEYIELAKHYCSVNSAKFINGILDKIVKELRTEGIIFKA